MSWPTVSFVDALADRTSMGKKVPSSDYQDSGVAAVVDQGQGLVAGYTDDLALVHQESLPVIVFGDHTRALKYVDFPFCMGADGVKVLKPAANFDPKFLYYYLMSRDIPSAGYSRHFKFLKELEIPVPPLAEQERIAEVLDRVDASRAKRRQALALLNDLAQSVFLDMFGDPVTNPKGWPLKSVGEIGRVITGNTPSRTDQNNFGTAIEWIKSDNIDPSRNMVTAASEGLSDYGRRSARVVGPGALLVTCIAGSPNSIGNVAMTDRTVAFNQQINALVPVVSDSWFLYMQFKVGKVLVQDQSTGGMKGLVSKSRFASVALPVPPLDLQREFAKRVEAIEQEKAKHRGAVAKFDELFRAVQNRAFAGTLFT